MGIRILIADDHEVVRAGIASLLAETDIVVASEVSTGEDAVSQALEIRPDVAVLDVRMGGGDGLTALGRIQLDLPNLPVVIFSTYDNPTYMARAVALGASGYILKREGGNKLIDAIRAAASGENVWKRDELRRVTGALATPRFNDDVEVPLTQRESEVLQQLALGLTNKEIAMVLQISYETVKEHVQHILRKVGVADRTQAAIWAVRQGIV